MFSGQCFRQVKRSKRQVPGPKLVVESLCTEDLIPGKQFVPSGPTNAYVQAPVIFLNLFHDPFNERIMNIDLVRFMAPGSVDLIVFLTPFCGVFRKTASAAAAFTSTTPQLVHNGRRRAIYGLCNLSKRVAQLLEDFDAAAIFKL